MIERVSMENERSAIAEAAQQAVQHWQRGALNQGNQNLNYPTVTMSSALAPSTTYNAADILGNK
jgi:hypothetical protein